MTAPIEDRLEDRIEAALGRRPNRLRPLAGGCVGDVALADLGDGERVVVKSAADAGARLDIEGRMLRYLAERSALPVPVVLHVEPTLLIMDYIEPRAGGEASLDLHAADLLADLHEISSPDFGLEFDTLIGGLRQPNQPSRSWIDFFRERRLLHMAGEAAGAGRLPEDLHTRIRRLADRLDDLLEAPARPSLIHGDVWAGNVIPGPSGVGAFIDPAIHYADAEIELAFIALFGAFGQRFFDRYRERRGIRDGFFERRLDLLNLYPLLVHVRLFGGGYVASVERILRDQGI